MGCLNSKPKDSNEESGCVSPAASKTHTAIACDESEPSSSSETRPSTFVIEDQVLPEEDQKPLSPISIGSTYDAGLPREVTDTTPSPESEDKVAETECCKTLKKLNAASLRNADESTAAMSAVFRAALRNAPENRASDLLEDGDESEKKERADHDGDYQNLEGESESRRASVDTAGQHLGTKDTSDPEASTPVAVKQLGLLAQEMSANSRSKSYDDALDKAGVVDDTNEQPQNYTREDSENTGSPIQQKKILGLAPQFRLSVALAKEFKGKLGLPTKKKVYIPPAERAQLRQSQRPMQHTVTPPMGTTDSIAAEQGATEVTGGNRVQGHQIISPIVASQNSKEVFDENAVDEGPEEPEYEYAHDLMDDSADDHNNDAIAAKVRTLSTQEVDDQVAMWEEEGIQEYIDSTTHRPSLRHAKDRHYSTMSKEELDDLVSSWEAEGKEIVRTSVAPIA
eukprot:m.720517 g.720517  ORF g.720517 m.720517 type:complete len:454 (+) comp23005_c0_seq7:412-1773(+)